MSNMKDIKGKDKTLGKRIALLRNACGLTQEELASELYVSRPSLTNYENGARTPDIALLQKLCNKFGVSMNYLLGNSSLSDEINILARAETNIKPYLTKNGNLNLSDAPPLVKIIVVELYLFLMHRHK